VTRREAVNLTLVIFMAAVAAASWTVLALVKAGIV